MEHHNNKIVLEEMSLELGKHYREFFFVQKVQDVSVTVVAN